MIFRRIFKRLFPLTVDFRVGSPSHQAFARLDDNVSSFVITSENLITTPPSPSMDRLAAVNSECQQLVRVERPTKLNALRRTLMAVGAIRRRFRSVLPVGKRRASFEDAKCLATG